MRSLVVFSMLAGVSAVACAQAEMAPAMHPITGTPRAPTLQLEATATGKVPYDLAVATLFVEREGPQGAEPTAAVNRELGALLAEARAMKGVDPFTGAYFTQPIFDRAGMVSGYRVRGEIRLESRDFTAFADALARLSARAPVAQLHYDLSPAARSAEEERLLEAAAEAFRRKATAAASALGFARYALLEAQVGTGGGPGPRPVRAMAASVAPAEMAPPPVAPELATITVTMTGKVRLEDRR